MLRVKNNRSMISARNRFRELISQNNRFAKRIGQIPDPDLARSWTLFGPESNPFAPGLNLKCLDLKSRANRSGETRFIKVPDSTGRICATKLIFAKRTQEVVHSKRTPQ